MLPHARLDNRLTCLKQGNALELELIEQLKDGLDFIVEGMRKECYNRSDALSNVQEKLGYEVIACLTREICQANRGIQNRAKHDETRQTKSKYS
jgi:hypothetical protein